MTTGGPFERDLHRLEHVFTGTADTVRSMVRQATGEFRQSEVDNKVRAARSRTLASLDPSCAICMSAETQFMRASAAAGQNARALEAL